MPGYGMGERKKEIQEIYIMPHTGDLLVFKNLLILFVWFRKWQNKKI